MLELSAFLIPQSAILGSLAGNDVGNDVRIIGMST